MKKQFIILSIFLFGFISYSFACDNAELNLNSLIDNCDGSFTYNMEVCFETRDGTAGDADHLLLSFPQSGANITSVTPSTFVFDDGTVWNMVTGMGTGVVNISGPAINFISPDDQNCFTIDVVLDADPGTTGNAYYIEVGHDTDGGGICVYEAGVAFCGCPNPLPVGNVCPVACSIDNITAGSQTACVPATNTYTQQITVTYSNPPATGTLDVNGQSFAITSSPQTVTLTGLTADGNGVNVTAVFSADGTCTDTQNSLFTAPANCSPVCSIDNITAGSQTACVPATNTYTQQITVTYTAPPGSGTLDVNGQSFAITSSPQTITLTGLTADGNGVNVTAAFSANGTCTDTQNSLFTAPANCSPVCSIDNITAGSQTACVPATNTYTQQITVTYTNPPTTGTLDVNGQSFAITSSPQTVTITGLTADGNGVNVTAAFSADGTCTDTQSSLFTAPASCSSSCNADNGTWE